MRKRLSLKKTIFRALLPFSTLTFLAFFFVQFNAFTKENSHLEKYTRELDRFSKENNSLEIGFFENNKLKNIEETARELNFERTERFHYIRVLGKTVVSR